MPSLTRAEVLRVPCPVCDAQENMPCLGPKGGVRWALHMDRRVTARPGGLPPATRSSSKHSPSPTDAQIVAAAEALGCVGDLCVYVDYAPNVGRVPELVPGVMLRALIDRLWREHGPR
jgi:hypothetical protein